MEFEFNNYWKNFGQEDYELEFLYFKYEKDYMFNERTLVIAFLNFDVVIRW
jgi:hypothetical protein